MQASRQGAHTSTKLLSIMKIHIDIDDAALAGVQTLGGFATQREAVNAALNEFARTLAARKLLDMRGTVSWDGASTHSATRVSRAGIRGVDGVPCGPF